MFFFKSYDCFIQLTHSDSIGKLRSAADTAEMAKKALQSSTPINPKNTAVRKQRKGAPAAKTGLNIYIYFFNTLYNISVIHENFNNIRLKASLNSLAMEMWVTMLYMWLT